MPTSGLQLVSGNTTRDCLCSSALVFGWMLVELLVDLLIHFFQWCLASTFQSIIIEEKDFKDDQIWIRAYTIEIGLQIIPLFFENCKSYNCIRKRKDTT